MKMLRKKKWKILLTAFNFIINKDLSFRGPYSQWRKKYVK